MDLVHIKVHIVAAVFVSPQLLVNQSINWIDLLLYFVI